MKFDPINNVYEFEIFENVGLRSLVTTKNSFGYSDFNLTIKRQSVESRSQKLQRVKHYLQTSTNIIFPNQVSKDNVWIITDDTTPQEADAVITQRGDLGLGILTADCLPIVLCAPQSKTLALIHAGWRGVLTKLTSKTIDNMIQMGCTPQTILAAVGPSISPIVYEVGNDVSELFFKAGYSKYIVPKSSQKFQLDLWGIVRQQLTESGILTQNVEFSNLCSYQNTSFYSARRDGADTGRFATIALWE